MFALAVGDAQSPILGLWYKPDGPGAEAFDGVGAKAGPAAPTNSGKLGNLVIILACGRIVDAHMASLS